MPHDPARLTDTRGWLAKAKLDLDAAAFELTAVSPFTADMVFHAQQAADNALAKALNVPAPRINDIVRERRGVTADMAMRLARYFGGDARSWLNLRAAYDLRVSEIANAQRIEREITPAPA